jgi:hypothetical protein
MIRRVLAITSLCTIVAPLFAADYELQLPAGADRTWIGPEFWANRLHDWRLRDGRIECIAAQPRLRMRTLYLLNHRLSDLPQDASLSVALGLSNAAGANVSGESAAGILIGIGGPTLDYRSAALIHGATGPGGGIFVGVDAEGNVFVTRNDRPNAPRPRAPLPRDADLRQGIVLRVNLRADGRQYEVRATAHAPNDDRTLASTTVNLPVGDVTGGIALVAHPGTQQRGQSAGKWWFSDLKLSGDKIEHHPDHTFGPIASTQYTVSRGVMKLTAQFLPIGDSDARTTLLQVQKPDGAWKTVDDSEIDVPSYTATFRDDAWDASLEDYYRVVYPVPPGTTSPTDSQLSTLHSQLFHGTIRRDPVDKPTITVAGFTGNHNNAHGFAREGYDFTTNIFFPHADVVAAVKKHEPDLLFFSGDQVYEGDSPTFADSDPENIKLDYLYKWLLWCWAYRDLKKEIPSICEPDDHDVFQGNLWGQGGRKAVPGTDRYLPQGVKVTDPGAARDHDGGYVHPADFVRMVERTQTSHLPDPYDPNPLEQGLTSYYTDLVWGRIGVAILEDRKFKSGCNRPDMPPSGTGRPDHFNDPDFDVAKLDIPGVTILGERQLQFLNEFARDWNGQDMKLAVSQTIFANMATHHGGNLQRLIADLDSNGWPQTGRNQAIDALRRGFVFHLGGDQHLATIVHHGIAEHGDAIWSFCVPSVANFYPRAWAPKLPGEYSLPAVADYTGRHRDGFGHPVTVYAATNPGKDMVREPKELHNKMPGYGIVKFNKPERTITIECWPRFADPADPDARQYEGWPKTISIYDNYARKPAAWLPTIKVLTPHPVIEVADAATGEVIYTVRINGTEYTAPVFKDGTYRVRVSQPERNKVTELMLRAGPKDQQPPVNLES